MEDIKSQLVEFGFNPNRIARALRATKGSSLQDALDWIDEHGDDADIDDPIIEEDEEKEDEDNAGEEGISGKQCLVCNDCGTKFTSIAFAQLHAAKSGHEDFSESTEAIPILTEEEKKQRLTDLRAKLAEKRKQDALKREEEERQNDLIRRKASKDTAEIKQKMEEKARLKEIERQRREKQEDKIQRERIKAQIEEDRRRIKERAEAEKRRAQGLSDESSTKSKPVELRAEESTIKSDVVRLQIRLPDGSALRETLEASSTLKELLQLIHTKSGLVIGQHNLMIALPPRSFDPVTEGGKSLQELGLCPSASLVFRKLPHA